jgi:predicted ferric reductase
MIPEKDRLHPKFKLVLFASFLSKSDSIAMNLLLNLQKFCKANNSDMFTLNIRFSDHKQQRWDESFLSQELNQKMNIKKVWVCGPPQMEEAFDKYLSTIASKIGQHGLNFNADVEIL